MFGTNPISKPLEGDGQWLDVQDIFYTIQGEGPFAGQPAVFIRLAGCNLRCFFCDTDFESKRQTMSLGEIKAAIFRQCNAVVMKPGLVVVTGGEPLLQNVVPLVEMLAQEGYHVQFETAGTVWPEDKGFHGVLKGGHPAASLVCSPKTGKVHILVEEYCRHWKYLIRQGEVSPLDGLPIMSTQIPGKSQHIFRPPRKTDTVWLQPCEEYNVIVQDKRNFTFSHSDASRGSGSDLADQKVTSQYRHEEATQRNIRLCVELAMKYNYRISLQLHKLLRLP